MPYWIDPLIDLDTTPLDVESLKSFLVHHPITFPFETISVDIPHNTIKNLNKLNITTIEQLVPIIQKHKPNIDVNHWNALGLLNQALKLEFDLIKDIWNYL